MTQRTFRAQNRNYRYNGRKADGSPCCTADDLSALCDSCRRQTAENITDNASGVLAARRLSDVLKKVPDVPRPKGVNANGVPHPAQLAEAIRVRGGRTCAVSR